MAALPPLSSREVIAALRRGGFEESPHGRTGGSHLTLRRLLPGGGVATCTVVMGKRQIPKGTLASILRQAGLAPDEFLELLR